MQQYNISLRICLLRNSELLSGLLNFYFIIQVPYSKFKNSPFSMHDSNFTYGVVVMEFVMKYIHIYMATKRYINLKE